MQKWKVGIEWEAFNKSQTIPIGIVSSVYLFEIFGTALCGTTGIHVTFEKGFVLGINHRDLR